MVQKAEENFVFRYDSGVKVNASQPSRNDLRKENLSSLGTLPGTGGARKLGQEIGDVR